MASTTPLDDAAEIHAVMRPRRRQILPDDRVNEKADTDRRHDPAGRAARRLEHEHDQRDAENLVPRIRIDRTFEECVAAEEEVRDDDERNNSGEPVPPHDAMTEARRNRKQQRHKEEHRQKRIRAVFARVDALDFHLRRARYPPRRASVKERTEDARVGRCCE